MKLHLLCTTNRVPLSYELTAANAADACSLWVNCWRMRAFLGRTTSPASCWGTRPTAAQSLGKSWPGAASCWQPKKADRRPPMRQQQAEVCFAALKGVFGIDGTLAKTLSGLATRIAAKVRAYT